MVSLLSRMVGSSLLVSHNRLLKLDAAGVTGILGSVRNTDFFYSYCIPGSYHSNYDRVWDIWIGNNKGDNQVVTISYSLTLRLLLSLIATFKNTQPYQHHWLFRFWFFCFCFCFCFWFWFF
jgi:hypothetical protein